MDGTCLNGTAALSWGSPAQRGASSPPSSQAIHLASSLSAILSASPLPLLPLIGTGVTSPQCLLISLSHSLRSESFQWA